MTEPVSVQQSPAADHGLNPAQQQVIALLGRGGERAERAELPSGVGDELRAQLEDELAPVAEHLDPEAPLWVSKHALATVHACEAHHVATVDAPFEWSAANARGIVAHRAIEILTHWRGEPIPGDLVDETIARLTDDTDRGGIGGYLAGLGEFDRAELRGLAAGDVTRFTECFPPLKAAWRPRTEGKVRVELLDGRLMLSGKVDLTLGRPGEKVIIDLKTGSARPQHREDLRFYALLETISLGVPPRKLASYYLDAASTHPEAVSIGVLRAALRRTVDGVASIVATRVRQQEASRTAGPQCNWCPLFDECATGRDALAALDDYG